MNKEELILSIERRHDSALLNKRQAAKELQISIAQIDRLRKSGELKSVIIGGIVRIPVAVIAEMAATE